MVYQQKERCELFVILSRKQTISLLGKRHLQNTRQFFGEFYLFFSPLTAFFSHTTGHLAVLSTGAIFLPARTRPRVPPRGQVVQAVAGVAVTRRTHVTAATPVLDAAHGEPETRARAQLAPRRMFVGIHYGGAVTP